VAAGASIVVAFGIDALWVTHGLLIRYASDGCATALMAVYANLQTAEIDLNSTS
jgi:hypothetical protein